MFTRLIVPAILGALVLSAPVLAAEKAATPSTPATQTAATSTPGERCMALEKQFDAVIKDHGNAAKAGEAKTMRSEGGRLCTDGKHSDGIAKLEQGIRDLGVTPVKG